MEPILTMFKQIMSCLLYTNRKKHTKTLVDWNGNITLNAF